jgi:16S rRNA (cytidine1402-2'-O)-methyltransferase
MLYLIATPIGNLEDITLRALRVLKEVDLILAEDTRKTGILLKYFNIEKPLASFHDHNEAQKIPWVIEELKKGKNIGLVSSAGMPTVADPGYKLIKECRKQNLPLTALPGASSVVNALSLSSMPHDKFIFLGFLPRKSGERKRVLETAKNFPHAIIFLESPFRINKTLSDLAEIFGDKYISVAREMTKKFEEIRESAVTEAIEHFKKTQPKGEFVLIIDNHQ